MSLSSIKYVQFRFSSTPETVVSSLSEPKALSVDGSSGDRLKTAELCLEIANLQLQAGKFDDADRHYETAHQLFSEVGHEEQASNAALGSANVLLHRGRYQDASAYFQGVFALLDDDIASFTLASAWLGFGLALQKTDQLGPAEHAYEKAKSIYTELGQESGVQCAETKLEELEHMASAQSFLEAIYQAR